jgi:hypothetical protein
VGLLKKIFSGNDQKSPAKLSLDEVQEIINKYGNVLEKQSPPPGCVADSRFLPFPKETIKTAIIKGLRIMNDQHMKEMLKVGYIQLAMWQEGVGDTQLGLDFQSIDQTADPEELATVVLENASIMKKWQPLIDAESERLKNELVKLGLW